MLYSYISFIYEYFDHVSQKRKTNLMCILSTATVQKLIAMMQLTNIYKQGYT